VDNVYIPCTALFAWKVGIFFDSRVGLVAVSAGKTAIKIIIAFFHLNVLFILQMCLTLFTSIMSFFYG
jgi:hypothetical protein